MIPYRLLAIAEQANIEFVPPYGSGGALYLRPLLFGSGPRIGLQPADEYTLLVMAIPVGDYYKGGMKPTTAVVMEDYDRAAPRGVGHVKVGLGSMIRSAAQRLRSGLGLRFWWSGRGLGNARK